MGTKEFKREPCPDRIFDEISGAVGMAVLGGGVYHFFKGMYNSPLGERLVGGIQSVRLNGLRTVGNLTAWSALFSVLDCTMVFARRKEDPWNSIIAGTATAGILSMRQGLPAACRSALGCGILFACLEGTQIVMSKYLPVKEAVPNKDVPSVHPKPSTVESSGEDSSPFSDGIFGSEEKQEMQVCASMTEPFESFDPPSRPSFDCE